jgi:hypothetical protein
MCQDQVNQASDTDNITEYLAAFTKHGMSGVIQEIWRHFTEWMQGLSQNNQVTSRLK